MSNIEDILKKLQEVRDLVGDIDDSLVFDLDGFDLDSLSKIGEEADDVLDAVDVAYNALQALSSNVADRISEIELEEDE